jgi:uncharacterized iron-regulated membrane protein
MTHSELHHLTMLGTAVFVLAACVVLALGTLTAAAAWVGRGEGARQQPPQPPHRPLHDDDM